MQRKNLPVLLIASLISAFIGQMFGVGGGFIYGPILLHLGANPIVVASTCLYIIIFSSSASMFMFLIFGKLNLVYTLWIALYAGIGVIVGITVMKKAIKHYKRPSLVAFCLALACMISAIFAFYGNINSIRA